MRVAPSTGWMISSTPSPQLRSCRSTLGGGKTCVRNQHHIPSTRHSFAAGGAHLQAGRAPEPLRDGQPAGAEEAGGLAVSKSVSYGM